VTSPSALSLDQATVRRLQLTAQRLAGSPARSILDVVKSVRRIQLDPTNAVARSHELVLWSRLGSWDRSELTRLLETKRRLMEFEAFIIPTENWPIFAAAAAEAPIGDTRRVREIRAWLRDNDGLRRHILDAIEEHGALPTSGFEDVAARDWKTSGWNDAKNVSRMLELLATRGEVIRAGRRGTERLWELPQRWLPKSLWTSLPFDEALVAAIDLTIRARGCAPMPPRSPFAAAPWPFARLPRDDVLAARTVLLKNGTIVSADIEGVRGDWFVHRDFLDVLDVLRQELRKPRTTLLSPFDPIVSDRDMLKELWGFGYRLEIYVPRAKRQFGYYVLPILHGDRFVGRMDAKVERDTQTLLVNRIYAEADAPLDADTGTAIGAAIADLAAFAGAMRTMVHGPVPGRWATGLRRHTSITVARRS